MKKWMVIGIAATVLVVVIIIVILIVKRKKVFAMAADFKPIYAMQSVGEGGYQADPADSANYNSRGELVGTMRGISAKAFEGWIGRPPTVADMKAIDEKTAFAIAKKKYWDPMSGDLIKNQGLAHAIFKEYWGSGLSGGGKRIQETLAKFGVNIKATDGISAEEAKKINDLDLHKLYGAVRDRAIDARFSIATRPGGDDKKFLRGWLKGWKKMDKIYSDSSPFNARWMKIDERLKQIGLDPVPKV